MSLDSIQLQPFIVQGLFRQSLVEIKSKLQSDSSTEKAASLSVLGKNQQHIVIVVNDAQVAFLADDELNFLLGILAACKLNMDDVCIVNVSKNKGVDYTAIATELSAEKIFLFGTEPAAIKLPLAFPEYQIQQYNKQVYLAAPALSGLQHDKAEKTKLWNCLKQIFSI